jgi:hypothetical protein
VLGEEPMKRGLWLGAWFGFAFSFALGLSFPLSGLATCVIFGLAFGMWIGVWLGIPEAFVSSVCISLWLITWFDIMHALAFGIGWLTSYFRLPFLPVEALNSLYVLFRRRNKARNLLKLQDEPETSLHQSLAYWDEVMRIPQPFLMSLLISVATENRETARSACLHLIQDTNQRIVALSALLEIESLDLLQCHTVEEIARLGSSSSQFFSEMRLHESRGRRRLMDAFARCEKVSVEISAANSSTSNYHKLTVLSRARRQLDDLNRFTTFSLRSREGQVFSEIAQQWLNAVNSEIDRLTVEERVSEKIPNPFVAPTPLIQGSKVFFGRSREFRFMEEHFLRKGQISPIVLFGQPRIGKSSILRNLTNRLTMNLIPVYVDMHDAAQVESTGGLLFNFADAINRELKHRGFRLPPPRLNDYGKEPFIIARQFFDSVEEVLRSANDGQENRLILALDEFEEIERQLTEGKISRDFLPFLRSLMQQRQGISLLFAGTHTLDEMISDIWVPYFRSAVPYRISYLEENSVRQLITNPIEEFHLNYEPEAVDYLIEHTHCHPCLIQLTCSALVDLKNEQRSSYASIEDIEWALARALETGDYVFRGVWEWIPKTERQLLFLLASLEPIGINNLTAKLASSESIIRGMVERLVEAEILVRGNDGVRFQVKMFRQWVVRQAARAGLDIVGESEIH